MIILAAISAWAALTLSAQTADFDLDPAPETSAPIVFNWGPDYKKLREVFNDISKVSGCPVPIELISYPRPEIAPDGTKLKDANGKPMMATYPNLIIQTTDKSAEENKDIIEVNEQIFAVTRNADELAFALAHEISHLTLHHEIEYRKLVTGPYSEADFQKLAMRQEKEADLNALKLIEQFNAEYKKINGQNKYKEQKPSFSLPLHDRDWAVGNMNESLSSVYPVSDDNAKQEKAQLPDISMPANWGE